MLRNYISVIITAVMFPMVSLVENENSTMIYKTPLKVTTIAKTSKVEDRWTITFIPKIEPAVAPIVVIEKIQKPKFVRVICHKGEKMWHSHHMKYRLRRTC